MSRSASGLIALVVFFSMAAPSAAATYRYTDPAEGFELDARAASVTTTRTQTRIAIEFTRRSDLPVSQTFVGFSLNFGRTRAQSQARSRRISVVRTSDGRVIAILYDGVNRLAPVAVQLTDRRIVVRVPTARLRPASRRGKIWFRADLVSRDTRFPVTVPPGQPPPPGPPPVTDSIPDKPQQISLG